MWNLLLKFSKIFSAFSYKHYKLVCFFALLISLSSTFFIKDLKIDPSLLDIRGLRGGAFELYKENLTRFGESSPVVLIQKHENVNRSISNEFTRKLVRELRSMDEIISVQAGPFDLDDTEKIVHMIRAAIFQDPSSHLQLFLKKFSLEGIKKEITRTRKRLIITDNPELRDFFAVDVFFLREILEPFFKDFMANLNVSPESGYFDSADNKVRLIFAEAGGLGEDSKFCKDLTEKIQKKIKLIKSNLNGSNSIYCGFAGKYGLTAESSSKSRKELVLITLFSSFLIFILLVLVFRNLQVTLICLLPILFSVMMSFLIARLFFNPLKMISVASATIVLGLGIDITFHLSSRFFQYKHKKKSSEEAIHLTMIECTVPLVIGILTTASGFFILFFSRYSALRQFGLLTSFSLFLTLILTLVLFPAVAALLKVGNNNPIQLHRVGKFGAFFYKKSLRYQAPSKILACSIILFSVIISFNLKFDMGLFKLFPQNLETLKNAREISEKFSTSFLLSTQITIKTDSLSKGMDYQKSLDKKLIKLVQNKKIAGFYSPRLFVALPHIIKSMQQEILDLAKKINQNRRFFFEQLDLNGFNVLPRHQKYYDILENTFDFESFDLDILVKNSLKQFLKKEEDYFYLQTYVWPLDELGNTAGILEVSEELKNIPSVPMVEKELTGTYQVHQSINKIMKNDFVSLSLWAGVVITLLLFIFFNKIKAVFFSLLPLFGAIPLTLAFITLTSISFSPTIIIVVALLIGIGLDDSVHLIARKFYDPEKKISDILQEIAPVLTLTSLSTMICFFTLGISSFPFLSNAGTIIGFGVFSCWLFTMFLLPPFLNRKI